MGDSDKRADAGDPSGWPTALEESFSTAPEGWTYAATTTTPPLRHGAPGVVMTLPPGGTSVAAYWYEKSQFTDARVRVLVTLLAAEDPAQSYCGVSFRARSDKDNYRLFIDGEGFFRLTRRVDNASTALVDWTRGESLKPGVGVTNELEILLEGAMITVTANGEKLASVADPTFTRGHLALQAQGGSEAAQNPTVYRFEQLRVAAP